AGVGVRVGQQQRAGVEQGAAGRYHGGAGQGQPEARSGEDARKGGPVGGGQEGVGRQGGGAEEGRVVAREGHGVGPPSDTGLVNETRPGPAFWNTPLVRVSGPVPSEAPPVTARTPAPPPAVKLLRVTPPELMLAPERVNVPVPCTVSVGVGPGTVVL